MSTHIERTLGALALGLLLPGLAQAAAHHPSAEAYMDVTPANNEYLFSSQGGGILTIVDGVVTNKTVCGAFVGRVFKNQWPELTQTVMQGLFDGPDHDSGQGLPNSAHWYDAIVGNGSADWSYSSGGKTYAMARLASFRANGVTLLEPGMVLVSKYGTSGDASGHTMLVRGSTVVANPGNAPAGTDVTLRVNVWDSTKSEHTTDDGAATELRDSRIVDPNADGSFDQGAGTGFLHLFLDASGQPLGWTWGIRSNATPVTNPIVAGSFTW